MQYGSEVIKKNGEGTPLRFICGSMIRLARTLAVATLGLFADALVDLFTMHRNVLRCIHTDADLVAFYAEYGDGDIVTYHERLSDTPRQYEHWIPPWCSKKQMDRTLILYHNLFYKSSYEK